jgi:mRNA interferase YafQ
MLDVQETNPFKRDAKRMQKRGKDMRKLRDIVLSLANGETLARKHCPHPLKGNWKPKWDCHIEPDWVLIYEVTTEAVILHRTGAHTDLFD